LSLFSCFDGVLFAQNQGDSEQYDKDIKYMVIYIKTWLSFGLSHDRMAVTQLLRFPLEQLL